MQDYSRTEASGQGNSDPKTVHDTPQPQGASTHRILFIPRII